MSIYFNIWQIECDANADLQYSCIEGGGTSTEVCHLARQKRSADRFKSRATRKSTMNPVLVCKPSICTLRN